MTGHFSTDEATPSQPSVWSKWLEPPTVIAIVAATFTIYGSQVIQGERLESMRAKLEAIERDYQRRDVIAEQLRAIDARLFVIERKLQVGDGSSR